MKKIYNIYDDSGNIIRSFDTINEFVSYIDTFPSKEIKFPDIDLGVLEKKESSVTGGSSISKKVIIRRNGQIVSHNKEEATSAKIADELTEEKLRSLWKI